MSSIRSLPVKLMIVALSVVAFGVAAHVLANALIGAQRARQLQELNEVALRRLETAVDFGSATLTELAHRNQLGCDAVSLQVVRLQVYRRGAVKDIRIVNRDGSVVCSAYSETLEFDNGWPGREDMLPAADGGMMLFRVDQINGAALGLLKDIDRARSLVAILGVGADLLDIMPWELRDHSQVTLRLGDGQEIAHYTAETAHAGRSTLTFEDRSTRYPIRTAIAIDAEAFSRWHAEPYWPFMLGASLLGLAFGILLAQALARPRDPALELDRALAAGELRPYYQPIFDLKTGAVIGCEALARWIRAGAVVEPPSRFIPLAERSGRIEALTWSIYAQALKELQPLLRENRTFKLSVNIGPQHMLSDGFLDTLRRHTREARVSARQIVLEVTEREELPDLDRAARVVADLRDYGFRVAIDDVGIGHSGLSQIQRLGANIMKIDKFFVDRIALDVSANAVVETLVRLARELKMTVVAEGIESSQQAAALMGCGVEQGQGYLVSPAVPPERLIAMLEVDTATRDAAVAAA